MNFRFSKSLMCLIGVGLLLCCQNADSNWIVYYGSNLQSTQLEDIKIAVVDPDQTQPKEFADTKTRFIAYLSIGEAESYRTYWPLIKNEPQLIVEANSTWKQNHLIDVRNAAWQKLILAQLIPDYVNRGFSGLFLDTIDVPLELERRDPKKFAKSKHQLITLIQNIHKQFPKLTLYVNNGLEILPQIQNDISGVIVEDLYTHYDFVHKKSIPTDEDITVSKEEILKEFIRTTKKPVLTILYDTSANSELIQNAKARCRIHNFKWFVATVDLQTLIKQE